ncbi:Kelch repeat-containing protein [Hyalangium versicolor]|uniref:Kelch repeat-containing protein n=1 Tax=Hyalangium versicolor TaxID=2861190 RepID=UPI001CCC11A1|nr:kelch repeat-containing protein [Hyalangium versicolor]
MKYIGVWAQPLLLAAVIVGWMGGCGLAPQEPSPSSPEAEIPSAQLPSAEEPPPSSEDGELPESQDVDIVPSTPPEILEAWQSASATPEGGTVTLRVSARPPREGILEFSWKSQAGSFSAPSNTATASEIRWTAPGCGTGLATHTLQVSIRDSSGLSTSTVFTISGACPRWVSTGDMVMARHDHVASVLPSGKVLVTGRYAADGPASVEEYDPATHTWSSKGDMHQVRRGHTASVLPSGQVLVAGGYNVADGTLRSAELYEPAAPSASAWSPAGNMAELRTAHTATVLPSGKVLIAGGFGVGGALASAELYDGATPEKWTRTGSMATGRYGHTATLLPSGKVLIVGGYGPRGELADAELYDPVMDSWAPAGAPSATGRAYHTATLLPSGHVLVAGGDTAEVALYDSTSGRWSQVGSLAAARAHHTATLLPSGKVLVVGGMSAISLATTEVYDPVSQIWSPFVPLGAARSHHTACLLPSGQVLVAGGHTSSSPLTSAELLEL